jgi:hypothetical protein
VRRRGKSRATEKNEAVVGGRVQGRLGGVLIAFDHVIVNLVYDDFIAARVSTYRLQLTSYIDICKYYRKLRCCMLVRLSFNVHKARARYPTIIAVPPIGVMGPSHLKLFVNC